MLTLNRGQKSLLVIAALVGNLWALGAEPASAGHESAREGHTWAPGATHMVPIPYDGRHFNNWQCANAAGCFWDRPVAYGGYYGDSCKINGGNRVTLGDCGHRSPSTFRFLTGTCSGQPGCSSGVSPSIFNDPGITAVTVEGDGTWHYDVWPNPTSFAVRVCTEWGIGGGPVDAAGHRVVNGVVQNTAPLCGRWVPDEVEEEPGPEPCPPGQTRVEGVCKTWCSYTGTYLLPSQRCNRPTTREGRGLCYGITASEIFDEAIAQNKAPEFWVDNRRFFPRVQPSSITAEVDEEVRGSVYRPSDYSTNVVLDGLGENWNRRANCGSVRARLIGLQWEFRGGGDPTVVKGGREITGFNNYRCTRAGGWGDCTGSLRFRFGARTVGRARFVVTAYWETYVRPRSTTGEPPETFLSDTSTSIAVAVGPQCTPAPPPESVPLVAARLSWETRMAADPDYEATGDEPWQLPLSHPGAESFVLTAGGEMWPVLVGDSPSLDVVAAETGCSWRMDKVVIGFRELHPWVAADASLIDRIDPGPAGLTARWGRLSRSDQDRVRRWTALNGQPAPLECRRQFLHGSAAAPERHCRWTLPRVGIWRWTMDVYYRLDGRGTVGTLRVGEGTEWFVSPADHAAQRLTFAY